MKKLRFSVATLFFYSCIGQSCSQQTGAGDKSLKQTFEATTPCNDEVKEMLGIPADFKCEMMKWNLTLSNDSKMNPSIFNLVCTYGLTKQGTKGFTDGAKTIELKGKWVNEKSKSKNSDIIITLFAENSPVTLSFFQPGQNLLHLLNKNKQLVNGTAAWSYTLNRTDPVTLSAGKFTPRSASSMQLPVSSDNTYRVRGTWKLLEGTIDNPGAVVYQLLPDGGKSQNQLLLLKADDNILFFIDNDTHLLVGNTYCSYTLNRNK